MKAYFTLRNCLFASIMLLIFSACNPTRFLTENQSLVKKVTLKGIDAQYQERVYAYVQTSIRPNSKFTLALYNTFNTKHGKYKTSKIRNIGEAPHLLDSGLVELSRKQIERYLQSKGFFKAVVTSDMAVKNKKAEITFSAERGPVFKVRNFTPIIADTAVKSLYEANRNSFTRLKVDKRYDQDSVLYEIENIYTLMKQNGYYDFLRQYSHVYADTNLYSSQVDLKLYIYNPPEKNKHTVYTLNNTFITIKKSDATTAGKADTTIADSQYHFIDYTRKLNARAFSKYIFLQKGDKYNIDKEDLTYNRLYQLNVFKSLKIDYIKTSDSTNRLNGVIEAIPLKQMSNRIEGEYTFNTGRRGFNIGNTYTNRNLFGGAEQLEVKFQYGILFDAGLQGSVFSHIFNRDLQLGVNLILPKLLVPFGIPLISRNGLPHTTISSSVQLFNQPGAFTNRIVINSLTYDWVETKYKLHSLTPITIEYRDGKLNPAFRESLRNNGYELYVRTNDRRYFSLGSQYTFTFNTLKLLTFGKFTYFKANVDVAGNTLGLLSNTFKLKKDSLGSRTIFGLPYLQYAKTELDFRQYWHFGGEKQLVVRLNPGAEYPYGNSRSVPLPFEKNFYAGGSNGIRAWQARTLGPGKYNRASIPDSLTRRNLRGLDQFGEVKIEGNVEYRFNLINSFIGNKLKGAVFSDFGNVWRIRQSNETPAGEFKFNSFLKQTAIGAGFGFRYDVGYFVVRLDVGAKVRDPQFVDPIYGESPWVIKNIPTIHQRKAFRTRLDNINNTDRYNFLQYNFGIGLPF